MTGQVDDIFACDFTMKGLTYPLNIPNRLGRSSMLREGEWVYNVYPHRVIIPFTTPAKAAVDQHFVDSSYMKCQIAGKQMHFWSARKRIRRLKFRYIQHFHDMAQAKEASKITYTVIYPYSYGHKTIWNNCGVWSDTLTPKIMHSTGTPLTSHIKTMMFWKNMVVSSNMSGFFWDKYSKSQPKNQTLEV